VDADLDTLATALYVRIDDLLKASPERAPWRPRIGITPKISDAELITLAVMAALLQFTSEARWLRHARAHLSHLFRYLPQQPGYNKRLRALAPTLEWLITVLAADTSLWTDDVWVVDSTPVECGRSRETARRSDLAGYAEYGYCASHSRYFWGLRLHLIATVHGLPVGFALTGAKADERLVLLSVLTADPSLLRDRARQIMIADKNYLRPRVRQSAAPERGGTAAPGPQGRTRPARRAVLPAAAPDHRVNLRDRERATRPRRPRRAHHHRRRRPGLPATPRPDRRDLAQRPHRPTGQTITPRLRPLTLESVI
jgi:hypothetical protein